MISCHRSQRIFCTEKGKDISIVKNREREGIEDCEGLVEKEVYSTIEAITDITSILYAKK